MDGGVLPLAFYCRNAQLYLQKAAESRKSKLVNEELQHLKAFTTLVTSSIPTHPQFRGWKDIQEVQPVDLHAHISEAKQRIRELEDTGSHLERPASTTNGQKSRPVLEPSRSKSVTSPRSKINNSSSSEVMLKTSKSVRISEASTPKQRPPQRWDIAMTETYGHVAKSSTARPVSLIQRLKRERAEVSKASPTRALAGKDVARPLSALGAYNRTSGESSSVRPIPRSRDSSRIRGGAGPSMPPSGRGSTALKALTSSATKGRALDEDCFQPLSSSSNRGSVESNGVSMRGCASASSSVARPASTSKLPNHRASSGGPWVRGILRNSSEDDTAVDSMAKKTNSEDEEELITWIPVPSRNEKSRMPRRSVNEPGSYGDEGLELEGKQRDHNQGELRELRANDGLRRPVDSNRAESAPVRKAPARVVKGTSPSSSVQQRGGGKESCERFRRQMRLLKEKAEYTRMREEEVESMAERLQRQLEDEIDLDHGGNICRNTNAQMLQEEESEEMCDLHRVAQSDMERTSLESLNRTMTRLMNGDYLNPSTPLVISQTTKKIEAVVGSASNSGSSGTSSQSSLPLSHYVQKPSETRLKNNAAGSGANQHRFGVMEHKAGAQNGDAEILSMTVSRTDSSERRELSLSSPGSSTPAILLPASSSSGSPKGTHRHPPLSHHGKRLKSQGYQNSIPKSDTSSVAMVRTTGAMVAANYLKDGGKLQGQPALCYSPGESRARALSRSMYETVQHDVNDEKIAHLQRVLGELRGSMEGVKIRIEVEGEGWRGRVDRLEKELESIKEVDEEMLAAKHDFKNELTMKLSEFKADTEKLLLREREQVQVMVEERIEKQLKAQHLAEMKDEMHLLWNEMDSLIKSREDMAGHVEHLTFFTKEMQEHSSREQGMLNSENGLLRKQLQSFHSDNIPVCSETDKEDLRQEVEKLKNDGNDMKLEIQGLKNIEKILKVEMGDLRTRLGKVQDETEELEREKEMTLVEGARERLLIMERVESLSQLYLGGLEEVRQDLVHVKFGFNERVEEIESQWIALNKNQGLPRNDGNTLLPRQVLLDELDQFRSEIAEMVDIERALLKEMLEKESTSIWRKVMDAYANNKSEMLNMLKLEIQKQLHSAREKVLLMTDALKCDMDALKTELSETKNGAKELTQIISTAEGQKEVAAQAALDATSSASKAREVLTDMLTSIGSELSNARHETVQLQGKLAAEKDMAIAAASEARMVSEEVLKEKEAALAAFQEVRQKSHELQDYLEKESPKLLTAMVVVQKERDTASQAAAEATSSAMKAGEVLAEVLGSFNLEMAKARHINMQLQEELEHERGLGTQHNQEVQDRISEELEVAIATWKNAMNDELAKAKEIAEGVLGHENFRHLSGFSAPLDLENYILKTEEKLSSLMETIEELQDSTSNYRDEKKRLKQNESERNEKDWSANISQLNQVVRTVEGRVNETSSEQSELRKRLKRFEGIQTDLIHSVGEVRSNTCTLEKTVNLFLPQYDAAARIVDSISCKVERLEERVEGFACDEGLAQVISRLAETKIESLKELAHSNVELQDLGRDLRDLQGRVENNDHSHCQAIAEVESRVAVAECTLSNIQNGGMSERADIESMTENVDALQRKVAMLEQNGILSDQEPVTGARVVALENRVEHVASATFSNLQLLDNKVERVSMGVQSAHDGAALAENKCGALGVELVKVFRMLTATKNANAAAMEGTNWPVDNCNNEINVRGSRGRSLSPPSRSATQRLDSRSQSPPPRLTGNPAWKSSRGPSSPLRRSSSRPKAGTSREKRRIGVQRGRRGSNALDIEGNNNHSSELLRKVETTTTTTRERPDRAKAESSAVLTGEADIETSQGGSPPRDDNWLKSYPREALPFKGRFPGQALMVPEHADPYMPVDRRGKNLQKTNIRLESGRIHVNVSRRSGAASGGGQSGTTKRGDAIAVQS